MEGFGEWIFNEHRSDARNVVKELLPTIMSGIKQAIESKDASMLVFATDNNLQGASVKEFSKGKMTTQDDQPIKSHGSKVKFIPLQTNEFKFEVRVFVKFDTSSRWNPKSGSVNKWGVQDGNAVICCLETPLSMDHLQEIHSQLTSIMTHELTHAYQRSGDYFNTDRGKKQRSIGYEADLDGKGDKDDRFKKWVRYLLNPQELHARAAEYVQKSKQRKIPIEQVVYDSIRRFLDPFKDVEGYQAGLDRVIDLHFEEIKRYYPQVAGIDLDKKKAEFTQRVMKSGYRQGGNSVNVIVLKVKEMIKTNLLGANSPILFSADQREEHEKLAGLQTNAWFRIDDDEAKVIVKAGNQVNREVSVLANGRHIAVFTIPPTEEGVNYLATNAAKFFATVYMGMKGAAHQKTPDDLRQRFTQQSPQIEKSHDPNLFRQISATYASPEYLKTFIPQVKQRSSAEKASPQTIMSRQLMQIFDQSGLKDPNPKNQQLYDYLRKTWYQAFSSMFPKVQIDAVPKGWFG